MNTILEKIQELAQHHDKVTPELLKAKDIKLGLRNADGTGVIVGITSKGRVVGYAKDEASGEVKSLPGKLYYCGYDAVELTKSIHAEGRLGYDEVSYLLLTGELPAAPDLERFSAEIARRRNLTRLERSVLVQDTENFNQMFALHSVVSHLARCADNPDSTDIRDVTDHCIDLIAKLPTIVAYNYNVMRYRKGGNLNIIKPEPELSTAENFLYMLKGKIPTEFEAYLFDMAMILHMEHGGGNNSTFTVRTVSSSGANTYMAICAGIASLSGHLHGGANEAVMDMMKNIKKNVSDWKDDAEISAYLTKILDGQAHDGQGKIYGMGHAVYTLSDPRAIIFREKLEEYARIKGALEEFELYNKVAEIGAKLLFERKGKPISPNVDFYSGLLYKLMGIPKELFTPIFAMTRVAGWSAHRIEQIVQNKIIRPAYVSSLPGDGFPFVPLNDR